jgi:hypothetical protein
VLKAYVELGLGVGIIAAMAFNPKRDAGLRLIDGGHLFKANTALIAVRRGAYLRAYAYRFIELCSPALPERVVKPAVMADAGRTDAKAEGSMPRRPPAQPWLSAGNTLRLDEVKRTA